MFVRVTNWATVLALALAATFAALLQWNEYALSLYQPSAERELLRSLSFVPIMVIGFFAMGGVAWFVAWRFSGRCSTGAEMSDLGATFSFFGTYQALIIGCLVPELWSAHGFAAGGYLLAYYASVGLICWLMYRWQGRSMSAPSATRSYIMGTEPWTYVWLVYGKLATPGLLALGYLNFQLRWQPGWALLVCIAYLVALRYALVIVHGLLHWPILTEEEMAP